MRYLFIHQNFPGQFRHLACHLASDVNHEVVAIGNARNLSARTPLHPRIRTLGYTVTPPPHGSGANPVHPYLRETETQVRTGQAVARLLLALRHQGWRPDIIAVHPAWGEALFLTDVYPDARVVTYLEYYYHSRGGDVGFDPEFPSTLDDQLRIRFRNTTQLHALVSSTQGLSPTAWQRARYPGRWQGHIAVAHDGIDTRTARPDQNAVVQVGDLRLRAGAEVVTYVARNLEPYRGFHTFMRSLTHLQACRPHAQVLVVGGDGVSYGRRLPPGQSYRQIYRAEVDTAVDWSRVHFMGTLNYGDYLRVLQVSTVHVYLSYPFVLSWSLLEAMACGCLVVGSATPPVQEVLDHGQNGLLTDFFDARALALCVADALERSHTGRALRLNARHTVIERYDLHRVALPAQLAVLHG